MSSKKRTLKNLSVILCMVLLITGILLLSAALMQTEALISFENPALLSGALPGFFIVGKFGSHKLSKSDEGCITAIGEILLIIFTFPFSLIFLALFHKKK